MIDRGRDTSSSLVIISRKMLIGGVLAISLFSFGLGYFFGYGGTSADKVVKRVEADSKIAPSEERTVLDSSGKPTMVPPPAMPGLVPKEQAQKQEATNPVQQQKPAATQVPQQLNQKSSPQIPFPQITEQKPAKTQPSQVQPNQQSQKQTAVQGKEVSKKEDVQPKTAEKSMRKKDPTSKNTDDNNIAPKKSKAVKKQKTQKKKTVKDGKSVKKTKKSPAVNKKADNAFFIQAGAFADRSKAEKLKNDLSANGFKSTLTTITPGAGKTLFRVRLGPYTTKKDADEHASGLKEKGFGSIIVPG